MIIDQYLILDTKCQYKAKSKGTIKAHIEAEHEGKTYSCPQCDYNTKGNRQLKKHINSKH